jgi:hypothetical protein
MSNDDEVARRIQRWKKGEESEKSARKILRRTARFYTFIIGFGVGIYFDFTGTDNSILGMIVGPFLIGGSFALLVTGLMFGIGL